MQKNASHDPGKLMATYLAFLRALSLISTNNHWQCQGPNFYGNHLLFERIYNDLIKLSDSAAERTVGLFGVELIDLEKQLPAIHKLTDKYSYTKFSGEENPYIMSSLEATKDFLKFSKNVYKAIKDSDDMTLGLDNLIMSISDKCEEHVYLLKQAI